MYINIHIQKLVIKKYNETMNIALIVHFTPKSQLTEYWGSDVSRKNNGVQKRKEG